MTATIAPQDNPAATIVEPTFDYAEAIDQLCITLRQLANDGRIVSVLYEREPILMKPDLGDIYDKYTPGPLTITIRAV